MEHIYHIRYEHNEKGKSIRQIARETGHDRETVKRHIDQEDFCMPMRVKKKRRSITDAYRDQVIEWLLGDEKAPRKQRHTAHRIFDRLKKVAAIEGKRFDVSERAIRSLVAELRQELGQNKLVALPLLHPPGEAQVDFGETTFFEKDIEYEGYHLAVTFPHSDGKYVQLFKGQDSECLARGLIDIFEHVNGVPNAIRFDNMSTAVKRIKAHGEREIIDSFYRLQCHFGFISNFCNPASGHEKGSVENYVGYSRRNFFVPVPRFTDLEEFNRELLLECDKDLERVHYKLEQGVKQLFEEDKANMKALPRYRFDACRHILAKTNQYGMCKGLGNSYSTAGNFRSCEVTLKFEAHRVTVLDEKSRIIVVHRRIYGKNKESMLWGPYLSVLSKRPNALKYSGFFEKLPIPLRNFLGERSLTEKKQILEALVDNSKEQRLELAIATLSEAVKMAPKNADDLLSAFAFLLHKPGQIPKNTVPEHIHTLPVYELNLASYANLLGGTKCNKN